MVLKMIVTCGNEGCGCADNVIVFDENIPMYKNSNVEIYSVEENILGWLVLTSSGEWFVDVLEFRYSNPQGRMIFHKLEQEITAEFFIEKYKLRQTEKEGDE